MGALYSRVSWAALTGNERNIPDFVVSRRPLPASALWGKEIPAGNPIPTELRNHRRLLRQFYSQRLIEPIESVIKEQAKRRTSTPHGIPPVPAPSLPTATAVLPVALPPRDMNLALQAGQQALQNANKNANTRRASGRKGD